MTMGFIKGVILFWQEHFGGTMAELEYFNINLT